MARKPDPFKPAPGATYSKEEVNRAGELLASWHEAPTGDDGTPGFDGWDTDELFQAYECATWWREQHARPLSNVAAGLRYHLEQEDALVEGRVDVTQRLKRRVTMINKLNRERGMKLARMEDIAGVRARLPDLQHLQLVSRRLRKTLDDSSGARLHRASEVLRLQGAASDRQATRSARRGAVAHRAPGHLGQPGRGRRAAARDRFQVRCRRSGRA